MQKFDTAREAALALRPDEPVYCFHPKVMADDAKKFMSLFSGKTAYAVKTNGERQVLDVLAANGVTCFDVASPQEIADVRAAAPKAEMIYMHPVKAQSHIRDALHRDKIRTLALDHEDELTKIHRIVQALDIDPGSVTKKFGAGPSHAVELLQRVERLGYKAGLCFHVGSQIEDPETYDAALKVAKQVRDSSGVKLAGLDIGGGFPAEYGHDPKRAHAEMPSLPQLMTRVSRDIDAWGFNDLPLIAEPGRVIVARAYSLIVRVLLRKGRRLYINDGIWASLSDSWTGKITLPARFIPDPALKSRNGDAKKIVPFRVCGATCDSVDILSRPFWLPETVDTGDWIEIGHIGAYSLSLRTRFNGFYPDQFVEVATPFDEGDAPEGYATLETMGEDAAEDELIEA